MNILKKTNFNSSVFVKCFNTYMLTPNFHTASNNIIMAYNSIIKS